MQQEVSLTLRVLKETLELQFPLQRTVGDVKDTLAEIVDLPAETLKLVYKGKLYQDHHTIQELGYKSGNTIFVTHQKEKLKEVVKDQVIPTMVTGTDSFNPVGFGNYQLRHMPEYNSAMSAIADPEAMQKLVNDPHAMSMMESMLSDPDTLRGALQNTPGMSQMIKNNPFFQQMLKNPELLKQIINPQTIMSAVKAQANPSAPRVPSLGGLQSLWGLQESEEMRMARLSSKYKSEIQFFEQQMGITDRTLVIRTLEQSNGCLFTAIDKLVGK